MHIVSGHRVQCVRKFRTWPFSLSYVDGKTSSNIWWKIHWIGPYHIAFRINKKQCNGDSQSNNTKVLCLGSCVELPFLVYTFYFSFQFLVRFFLSLCGFFLGVGRWKKKREEGWQKSVVRASVGFFFCIVQCRRSKDPIWLRQNSVNQRLRTNGMPKRIMWMRQCQWMQEHSSATHRNQPIPVRQPLR